MAKPDRVGGYDDYAEEALKRKNLSVGKFPYLPQPANREGRTVYLPVVKMAEKTPAPDTQTKTPAPVQYTGAISEDVSGLRQWSRSEIPFYFDPAVDDMTNWEVLSNALGTKVRLRNKKTGVTTKQYTIAEYKAITDALKEGKTVGTADKTEVPTGTGLPGFEGVKYDENGKIIGYNPVNKDEYSWNNSLGVQQSLADRNTFAGYRYNPEYNQSEPQSAENKAYLWTSTGTERNRYNQPAGTSTGVFRGVNGPRSRSGGSARIIEGGGNPLSIMDEVRSGFRNIRNKRRAVWNQRNPAGEGISGQAAGRPVSWNP